MNNEPDYGPAGEAKLRAFVEQVTGGHITKMDRQVRWRPAWFVDVDVNGETLKLHLRGDRAGGVAIFPELKREADVIEVLSQHGIAVPRIHGYCEDPPCIVMDTLPGSRNMAEAASDAARQAITQQYIAQVAAMHRLSVEPFVARGVHLPQGAEAIAMVGLEAYLPHYRRTKSRPEPMLEFVIGWLRRNVPTHRTRASFIQFDSGQFLHEDGRMTGLYDFEFSMIGDPMFDLATMRMRHDYEPLGATISELCRQYEALTGEPVDHDVVEFHTLQFGTLGTMQFTGTVGRGNPGDPHATYHEFDIALRQVILQSMRNLTGWALPVEPPPTPRTGDHAVLLAQLSDTLAAIGTASAIDESQKEAAAKLIEWLSRSDDLGSEMRARDLADVAAMVGQPQTEWADAMAALERHVLSAGPAQDEALFQLFARMEARRMHLFGGTRIGRSASHVTLPSTR
jgi:Phosphotransferase enzyme family